MTKPREGHRALHLSMPEDLRQAMDEAAATMGVTTTHYVNAVLRGAVRRGITDNLARDNVPSDAKGRGKPRGDWTKLSDPDAAVPAQGEQFRQKMFVWGPFTLRRLGANPTAWKSAGPTDGWWLSGPTGDFHLGLNRDEAQRRATTIVLRWIDEQKATGA